jgi:hypothetical protein
LQAIAYGLAPLSGIRRRDALAFAACVEVDPMAFALRQSIVGLRFSTKARGVHVNKQGYRLSIYNLYHFYTVLPLFYIFYRFFISAIYI